MTAAGSTDPTDPFRRAVQIIEARYRRMMQILRGDEPPPAPRST